MTQQSRLLATAAAIECLAGVVVGFIPDLAISLLFGMAPGAVGPWLGRLVGVALFSLGVACWGAVSDEGGPAHAGTVLAITMYNAGAGVVLTTVAATSTGPMIVAWIAAVVHLALAAAFVVSRSSIRSSIRG